MGAHSINTEGDIVFKSTVLALGFSALLFQSLPAHARLAAYTLECKGSPGATVSGALQGYIETTKRIITVRGSCQNAPSASIWPEIREIDGDILSMEVQVLAEVTARPGYPAFHGIAPCTMTVRNGFMEGTCTVNPNENTPRGRVEFLISIAPPLD